MIRHKTLMSTCQSNKSQIQLFLAFDKRKELLTVKVIVESELKDRLKDLLDIFESYNIKH